MVEHLKEYHDPKQFFSINCSHKIIRDMNIGSTTEVSFTCKLTEKLSEENYCELKTKLLLVADI